MVQAIWRLLVTLIIVASSNSFAASPDGRQLFQYHCASCHGDQGKGDGNAARYVYPKPRDFTRGMFKIRSTLGDGFPTDEDLLKTITQGMPGSAMPSFAYLREEERNALVAYVKTLVTRKRDDQPKPISVGHEPPTTSETISEGKKLYTQMRCDACHGKTGKGDGPSAEFLIDSWDYPIKVRNFTTGIYLGGPSNRDLYMRFTTGLGGTPMPSYADSLTDEQRWALVHYIQSLRVPHEVFNPPEANLIVAKRVQGGLDEKAFTELPDFQIPMMNLWPSPNPLHGIHVKTAHNGKQIGFRFEWDAASPSRAAVGQRDFRDGIAVQFSLKNTYPFLGMGDKDNPVNVWHWKSDWQAEVEGKRADVVDVHPRLYVDDYPRKEPMFLTASASGNLMAALNRKSPVEDLVASGFGTLEAQALAQQNLTGRGVWNDGKWQVIIVRNLTTEEKEDYKFKIGELTPVSFAVWAGANGDRDGQKSVSTWFNLKLEESP